jgi:catechol 2,3-dioxygenase-like lactoylglutathione lyase family enzyme
MIHHVSLGSNDLRRSREFYDPVLAVLQLRLISSDERELVYGTAVYLLNVIRPLDGHPALAGNGSHVAISAYDRGMVNEFYRIALIHGGTSDGAPGIRAEYDRHYYGAFVRDPDGNKIEAITYAAK